MRDTTIQILQQHKIKIENIKSLHTYGMLNDPLNPGTARNLNDSFGIGIKVKRRGYIHLNISELSKKEVLHLREDIEDIIKRNYDGTFTDKN